MMPSFNLEARATILHVCCKLILRKIIKIVATRRHILKLKCIKFDFGQGSAPEPAAKLTASPDSLAAFKVPTSEGGKRSVRKDVPYFQFSLLATLIARQVSPGISDHSYMLY